MALIFKFDTEQFQMLVTAINNLSDNLAKWQGKETEAIEQGFSNLAIALGGEDVQARIDALTSEVKTEADALEGSAQSET
jgi:hypothetical protein